MLTKRFFDIFISMLGLILLSPVFLFMICLIRKNMGKTVYFRQLRPGKNAKPFMMIKFRSMRDTVDKNGKQLPDAERITPFGEKLRSSSLDELPELWNVLRGDMSLVGPRPLLMEYVPLYTPEQARRMKVRPGITGWAQVNGRNSISWEEKFKLDIWYVENRTFFLDLKIIWVTIIKVFKMDGISADGETTMSKFKRSQ